jgi:hypothetical protein
VCAANESIDDEADIVASLPKGQAQGEEQVSFQVCREAQQDEEGVEPQRMEWAKQQR